MVNDEIVTLAQQGNQDAIELILKEYKNIITVNAKNFFLIGAEQEDLQQEGTIGLLKAIKNYTKEKSSFRTFATLCIRHQILSAVRNSTAQKNIILNEAISSDEIDEGNEDKPISKEYFDDKYNPENLYLDREIVVEFHKYVEENFSAFEKEVLSFMIQGFSYKEIAEKLERTPKVIDNCFQRIRKKIESWLKIY